MLQTTTTIRFYPNQAKAQSGLEYDPNDPATWPPCPLCDCDFDEYANCCCGGVDICDCITCGEQYDCGEFHVCCTETCICGEVYYCYKGHECDEETCPDCECLIDPWGECCCENEEDCQCDYCGEQYVCNNGHTCLCFCNNCQISYVCQEEHVCNCQCCGNNCTTCGKLLPTGLKSASTNTSCEVCSCPLLVYLIAPSSIVIGNDYSVQMIMEGSPRGYQVKLEMKANWEPNWNTVYETVSSSTSARYTREARTSGRITYKVTINEFNTNRTGTDEYDVYEEYPDVYEIIGNVGSQMSATWQATKSAASASGRIEKGFWIYFNTQTRSYEFEHVPDGPVVQCGTKGTINPGSPNALDASSSQDYPRPFVCFFHTHTPLSFCSGERPTGPSDADDSSASYYSVPLIAYDYSANVIYGGHNINLSAQPYTTGPNKRVTRVF